MSDQAFSRSEDLLFGSGELFFLRDNDDKGWKHLGNADDFIITTSIDAIDKHGSMNKKRELQARATTAIDVIAYATLTEYDYKNLALALFGDFDFKHQLGRLVTNQVYSVSEVPGLITIINEESKRYYGISDVTVAPRASTAAGVYWSDARNFGDITTVDNYRDTFTIYNMGGTIKIDMASAIITSQYNIYVTITKAPDAPGDLLGMEAQIFDGNSNSILYKTFTSGLSEIIILENGVEITFTLDGSHTFSPTSLVVEKGIKAIAVPMLDNFLEDIDYVADMQSCRAGIIKIPRSSRIKPGDEVVISCSVPDKDLCVISGGSSKEITGQLLFVPDANAGPNYVVEIWKVYAYPEGDLTGLITSDNFGTYKLAFKIQTDYEHHPEAPYYSMTLVDHGTAEILAGEYNPNY